jgi:hypothetical protein
MTFIGGNLLYLDERNTIDVDKDHPHHEKIMDAKKNNPIIFNHGQRRRAAVSIEGAKLYLFLSTQTNSKCNADALFWDGINELTDYIHNAGELSKLIKETVFLIAEEEGVLENLKESIENGKVCDIVKPTTVVRPYHLHHSMNKELGGGNYPRIIKRMDIGRIEGFLSVPASWVKNEEYCTIQYSVDSMDNILCAGWNDPQLMCEVGLCGAYALDARRGEMVDVYHELFGWTLLPCAMSLHRRLGKDSALGKIGNDVFKMIMGYVILNIE